MITIRILFALALAGAVSLGCGGDDGEGPEPGAGVVPDALLAVEGGAEDAFDHALADDLPAVSAEAVTISATWRTFRAEASSDGASAADLAAMDAAVAGLGTIVMTSTDRVTVARAANRISAPMDELFALYAPPLPTPVLALDYLGRELVLDGLGADFTGAAAHLDEVAATWGTVRPAVVAAGGVIEARDYDAAITAARAHVVAADGAALVIEANHGLDLVDAIEAVFAP